MTRPGIRVVLPAAGRSTRMGRVDKRLLPWRGTCLLSSAVERAAALDPEPIVVVRPGDRRVRETLSGLRCLMVENPEASRGSITSVYIGGAEALAGGADGIVVMLPDMPRVGALTLRSVADAFQDRGRDAVVGCDYEGVLAPPMALPARVVRALRGREGTVREALDGMNETRIGVPAPRDQLLDIDTPMDWRTLEAPWP